MKIKCRQLKKVLSVNKILFAVLLIAGILRLWKLGSIPPHLTPDEAALGYNAYSILKTAKDEYGEILPFIFKSFGDFKPGLYIYLTVPFVALLGLTEFAVRLPGALAGVTSVWLIYLVVNELFGGKFRFVNKSKKLSFLNFQFSIGGIAAFILATSPWHIHFSRGAWEVNVSLTLTLAGIYFFLRSLNKSKYLYLSAIFFSLTLLTYQGAKLSSAIALLVLVVVYWKKFWRRNISVILGSFALGFVIALPIIFSLFQGKTGRLEIYSVFSYPRPLEYTQAFLDQGNENVGDISYYLYHSEAVNFLRGIMGRWFNHFSGKFLFFLGDWQNVRHAAPNHGVLLLGDLVLIILGLLALSKIKKREVKRFILLWLVLAPLPAVLSRDQLHAVRAFNMVIPLILILSLGLRSLLEGKIFGGRRLVGVVFALLVYAGSLTYFFDAYFVHLPKHDSKMWNYGYKQIVETVTPIQNNYEKVKVQQSFAQPYIYFLFYQKYDPAKYQKQAKLVASEYKGDVGYIEKLDNVEFVPIDWSVNRGDHGSLIVGDPVRIPPEDSVDENLFKVIKEISYLDGYPAFRIIEVK